MHNGIMALYKFCIIIIIISANTVFVHHCFSIPYLR